MIKIYFPYLNPRHFRTEQSLLCLSQYHSYSQINSFVSKTLCAISSEIRLSILCQVIIILLFHHLPLFFSFQCIKSLWQLPFWVELSSRHLSEKTSKKPSLAEIKFIKLQNVFSSFPPWHLSQRHTEKKPLKLWGIILINMESLFSILFAKFQWEKKTELLYNSLFDASSKISPCLKYFWKPKAVSFEVYTLLFSHKLIKNLRFLNIFRND